jgi:hypothetical protein
MNLFSGSEKNWNEFQWEREIRRDERRISCYFRELACCLDLPGEEEMIYGNLPGCGGLVPSGNATGWRMWDAFEPEEDFDEETPETRRRAGDELIAQLDKLSCEWNVIYAAALRESLREEGLAVGCGFGKLQRRLADFTDTDAVEMRQLKLSLGKRALSDLNELTGMLRAIGELQRSLRPSLILLIELLQQIRERIVDLLSLLRKG